MLHLITPPPTQASAAVSVAATTNAELLNQVVLSIYQTVLQPADAWRHSLALMRELFACASAIVVVRPSSSRDLGYLVCEPRGPEEELAYQQHWYTQDPFIDLPSEAPMLLSDLISTAQWHATPFYKDFIQPTMPCGAAHLLGVNVVTDAGTVSRVRFYRTQEQSVFTHADKALLGTLMPHIKQAMALSAYVKRNDTERVLFEDALDRLSVGSVVLDEDGLLLRANLMAGRIFEDGDGLRLVGRRLESSLSSNMRELRRLLEHASARPGSVHAASLLRSAGRRKIGIVVQAIPMIDESEGRKRPAWALFLRDPEMQVDAPNDILRQLFGFTSSESALALALAQGLTLDECASKLGIRRNTARAHLRSIFLKADVGRQTELVRVLLTGVSGLSAVQRTH